MYRIMCENPKTLGFDVDPLHYSLAVGLWLLDEEAFVTEEIFNIRNGVLIFDDNDQTIERG